MWLGHFIAESRPVVAIHYIGVLKQEDIDWLLDDCLLVNSAIGDLELVQVPLAN